MTKEWGCDMSERKRLGDVETVPVGRTPMAVDGQGRIDADEWTAERARAQPPPETGADYPPWPRPAEEEPIDAEFTEERPTTRQRARRAWEESRRKAREFFSESVQATIVDHEGQRARDEERAATDDPEASKRAQLLKLRSEARLAGEEYLDSLRRSQIFVPGFTEEKAAKRLDAMHQVYVQMMVQGCLRPLSRGVNTNSIIQAVGMMTSMTLLSEDFREQTRPHLDRLREKIQDRIDTKTRSRVGAAEKGIERRRDFFSGVVDEEKRARLVGSTDARAQLSRKWRKRYDDLLYRERGRRQLYTPEAAALTELGLMENAFVQMRDPATESQEVYESYKKLRSHLWAQFEDDGLERQDIVDRVKTMVGVRMEHEPELWTMIKGAAHGRIIKDYRIDGVTGARDEQWRGHWANHIGARMPREATFSLRPPMTRDEHSSAITETMRISFADAVGKDMKDGRADGKRFREMAIGYMAGFAGRRQGMDLRGAPAGVRMAVEQSGVMMATMTVDGVEPEAQRAAYSMAYANAMDEVAEQCPEVKDLMHEQFGPDWKVVLKDAADNPQAFLIAMKAKPRRYYAGADGGPAYESARDYDAAHENPQPV